jgi:hypothetical protein
MTFNRSRFLDRFGKENIWKSGKNYRYFDKMLFRNTSLKLNTIVAKTMSKGRYWNRGMRW